MGTDRIYTIGFSGKTAREFFDLLNSTDAKYLADTRLNNNSQLAGFTKKGSIEFFVERLTRLTYMELPMRLRPIRICSGSTAKTATGSYTNRGISGCWSEGRRRNA